MAVVLTNSQWPGASSMQCAEDQASQHSIMDEEKDQETQHYLGLLVVIGVYWEGQSVCLRV